jgi:hypothetical protein
MVTSRQISHVKEFQIIYTDTHPQVRSACSDFFPNSTAWKWKVKGHFRVDEHHPHQVIKVCVHSGE